MAIIGKFNCYICGREFNMAYGGLFSNPIPNPRGCICAWCRDKQEALIANKPLICLTESAIMEKRE
jgi:hypothetical protein